jgi:hypothetical protein
MTDEPIYSENDLSFCSQDFRPLLEDALIGRSLTERDYKKEVSPLQRKYLASLAAAFCYLNGVREPDKRLLIMSVFDLATEDQKLPEDQRIGYLDLVLSTKPIMYAQFAAMAKRYWPINAASAKSVLSRNGFPMEWVGTVGGLATEGPEQLTGIVDRPLPFIYDPVIRDRETAFCILTDVTYEPKKTAEVLQNYLKNRFPAAKIQVVDVRAKNDWLDFHIQHSNDMCSIFDALVEIPWVMDVVHRSASFFGEFPVPAVV